ncbi:hypothetical protein AB6Q56_00995 [Dechloromonas sp. ARDL1]|uniref:hypothetical protein n=1 Tax=Dechloromonas sp. ARDL1 TaxID=3322121 RepID=UPI003DA72248
MKKSVLTWLLVCVTLSACTNTGRTGGSPLIPDQAIRLTAHTSVSLTTLLVGAAVYAYYDPLAPNWEIEEARLDDETYRFSMKMKRYHTGGSGESIQILKRRANQIQREQGFGGYQILEYNEGIDSQTIGARRVAEGTIKLVKPQQADSFMLN